MSQDPPLKALVIPVTPLAQNCSLIWCERTRQAAIVDPGGDVGRILDAITAQKVEPERILITHGHADHAGGAAELAEKLGVPIEGPHPDDGFWIDRLAEDGASYGIGACRSFEPSRWLADGDEVTVGEQRLAVLHCPGHTPGHVVFFHAGARVAFVGDVLFAGSVGRTDFPKGDHAALIASITKKLWPLGDDVVFVPGHGPFSTFGDERRSNPYVADALLSGTRR